MIKRFFALLIAATLLLCSCKAEVNQPSETVDNRTKTDEKSFSVTGLKIGKADCFILYTASSCVIVDCGEDDDSDEILSVLSSLGKERVDAIIISHLDKDHIGGADGILENINVGQVIMPDYYTDSSDYDELVSSLAKCDISPDILINKLSFSLDGAEYELYPSEQKTYEKNADNNISIATFVTFGQTRFLFTGDAEEERLGELISLGDISCDFLKVPYHGGYNEKTESFIKAVNPKIAVITASEKNPADERTLDILESDGCECYITSNGNITVRSDGNTVTAEQ